MKMISCDKCKILVFFCKMYRHSIIGCFIFCLCLVNAGCEKSNDKKLEFIKKHIAETNQKNIKKHGDLIVPDFLLDEEYVSAVGK